MKTYETILLSKKVYVFIYVFPKTAILLQFEELVDDFLLQLIFITTFCTLNISLRAYCNCMNNRVTYRTSRFLHLHNTSKRVKYYQTIARVSGSGSLNKNRGN